ncbi:Crp/Fnr family transcriptional regulator [Velocimicrobium porci]|uniref:Crp/Fnr family transcriptional regulator n=1 Tax=Velocimicrobium porci TaxID=2606634 RepID=A0A6L5Y0V4_9FIRM|nr:Crp/Fnr family transcriptional regulator [Velocimicrobium porci]MSS64038.1 Crp/Fnr family transcriptional regulator [Velocimicrobium porci]
MNKILSVLEQVEGEQKQFLADFFRNAPVWLLEACNVIELDKGEIFIREKDEVQFIYILTKGRVKASDFRILGIVYDFCRYEAIEFFGGMEVFIDCNEYMTTLSTITPCQFIVMHKEKFQEWMRSDANALWIHTKNMTKYLLGETRKERAYLFLQGIDRVYILFEHLYEQYAVDGRCAVRATRQQLSDETGLSVKTINRSLKQMMENELVAVRGSNITIKEAQYRRMKELTAEKIDS